MQRTSLLLALVLLVACGDDGHDGSTDAQVPAIDAQPVDAGEPDAFDECPGQATFQIGVEDWLSGEGVAGVVVSDGSSQTTSAPNGRVLLCVAKSGPIRIEFSKADYLPRVHSTTGEIVAALAATPGIASFRLLKPADADALYTGVAATRATEKVTVVAMVRERETGADAAGASLSLNVANEGAYTPGPAPSELSAGQVSQSDGRVLFLNADPGTGAVSATGLSACTAPTSIELTAGGVSSVTVLCSP